MALFPDEKVKLAASDYLMREGELTGAEYFAIQRGLPEHRLRSLVAGRIWPRLECYALWNAKKLLKAVGGEAWLRLRAFILARRERA